MTDQTTPPQTPDDTQHVQLLAQPTPRSVENWRHEDVARNMFSGAPEYASAVPDKAFDGANMSQVQRQTAVTELREMFADAGLTPAEAATLMTRSAVSGAGTPDQQRRAARDALERKFGSAEADFALNDAKRLVQRDPRLTKFLDLRQLGNDPETILLLASAARTQRNAGRLK